MSYSITAHGALSRAAFPQAFLVQFDPNGPLAEVQCSIPRQQLRCPAGSADRSSSRGMTSLVSTVVTNMDLTS